MVTFIAAKIEDATDISIEKGQAKYKAYFSGRARQRLYGKYQDEVDTILLTDTDETHPYDQAIVRD